MQELLLNELTIQSLLTGLYKMKWWFQLPIKHLILL